MTARVPNSLRWLVRLAGLFLAIWLASVFLASGSPRVSGDVGTLLHVDTASNQIHLSGPATVYVQKAFHEAANQNSLDLTSPDSQFIFNCTTAPLGTTVSLGVLAPGELRFQLAGPVDTFNTGLASDNPDSYQHANLVSQSTDIVRMLWEDLSPPFETGEPDHNDCIVDVIATSIVGVGGTTSFLAGGSDSSASRVLGLSTAAALAVIVASGIWYSRKRRRSN